MIGHTEMRWNGPYPPDMGQTVQENPKVVSSNANMCESHMRYWFDEREKDYPQDELELIIQFQERLDK